MVTTSADVAAPMVDSEKVQSSPDSAVAATPSQRASAALNVRSEQQFLDAEAHAMRVGVYQLLGRLLVRGPDADVLATLAAIEPVDASDGPIAMGWELLRQASQQATVESVEDEHFSLFIGVGRGELVPFGSWYLTGFLMEKPLAALRIDLDRLGIERQSGVAESEDHAAALCDAMAILIESANEAGLIEQQAFFNQHMAPWMNRFFTDLQQANNARFYRSVGFLGEHFMAFEQRLLAMPS